MAYLIMTVFTFILFISNRDKTSNLINSFFSRGKSEFSPLMTAFAISVTVSAVSTAARISQLIFPHTQDGKDVNIVYLVIVSVAVVPFAEEFFFRGILLGFLLYFTKNKTLSVIVSAVVFALFHAPGSMIFAFAGGVLISAFTVISGSFKVGLIIHYVNNLYAFAGVVLPSQTMIIADCGFIGITAALGIALLIKRKGTKI